MVTQTAPTAQNEAQLPLEVEEEIIRLTLEDQMQFAEALLHPPEPTPALRRAFQRRRELISTR